MLTDLARRAAHRATFEVAKTALERDLAALVQGAPAAGSSGGPRIGIATFGSGEWHLAIDLLLAHALAVRGARPSLLMCDAPALPVCDERIVTSRHQSRCDGCFAAKRGLLEAGRVPYDLLSTMVPAHGIVDAAATVAALRDEDLESFQFDGWPIGQWLHVSASHFLRQDARALGRDSVDARRRWLATAIVSCQAVTTWLDRIRPDLVLVQGGAHVRWRVARELARARGIPVMSREMGKGGWDHHLYALNADCLMPDLDAAWADARRQPLSEEEERVVDRWLASLPAMTHGAVASARPFRVPPAADDVRTAVAFTNVTWDLATAGRDVAFTGVRDWLDATIDVLASRPRVRLIVRVHPAEAATGTRERVGDWLRHRYAHVANLVLVDPEDAVAVPELLAHADVALAYNSTAGIEAATLGVPVVVCGAPHFRNRGFTIDVDTRLQYREYLDGWCGGAAWLVPDDASMLARRYMHLFFARYTIPMGLTTSPLAPPFTLRVRSYEELSPGRNAALDHVCSAILAARQPLLPREGAA